MTNGLRRKTRWLDKWDAAWNEIYADAENEKWKPKSEAAKDPNSQVEKDTWNGALMDALTKLRLANKTRHYICLFINPNNRGHGLKWVQTTADT